VPYGAAAYFYSFGLYLSVISISHDSNLRKSIQKVSIEEANMLHRLGSTQMQQEIQKRVVKLSRVGTGGGIKRTNSSGTAPCG